MPEHDSSADSPAREAAAASDQMDRELQRVLNDARRRYVRMRKEILSMLRSIGPLRAGLLARYMNEPGVHLKDIRPVLRRMANEGLVTTKSGDPLMYNHGWLLKETSGTSNDHCERDQRREQRRARRRG